MFRGILLASTCVPALIAAPVSAQEGAGAEIAQAADRAAAPAEPQEGAAIVVTGSRAIRDGSQAPTPVTVISSDALTKAQPGLIAEGLNQLPAFRGSTRPTGGFTAATGPGTGSYLNLRNLGTQRTLVLVDGRRAAPSARDGSTDINLLPEPLIKRVDVVTGGASAAYGSDAVAGVVNFVLDTRFTGLKATLQSGISGRGDVPTYKASLTAGHSFAEGRGRIVASASYYDAGGLQSVAERSWGRRATGFLSNPAVPGQLIFRDDLRASTAAPGGLILSGPLAMQQFAPDGTLMPFSRGTLQSGLIQVGGDGAQVFSNLSAAIRTQSYFAHGEFDVTPTLTLFGEGSLALARNHYNQVQQFNLGGFNGFTIYSGNAFLDPSVQQVLTATNTPAFAMGRLNFDFGDPANATAKARTMDFKAGFRFTGPSDLLVEGYYGHSKNRTKIRTDNNVVLERLYAAADAVRDPASGQIVCRVSLTNPGLYPGCVPLNLFGQGAPSQEAIDYVEGTAAYRTDFTQDVADISVRARPFSTWAGEVSLAAGGQYRRIELDQVSDDIGPSVNDATGIRGFPAAYLNQPGGYLLTNVFPVSGGYHLWELFAEAAVPLARDLPFLHALDLNAAVRYTDYSTSGGVTTWKAGLVWEPVSGVRLRGTVSRDIRAPNVPELFAGTVQNTGSVIESGVTVPIIQVTRGNAQLKPERARTYTAGLVLTPAFAPGLTFSADYYSIDLDGVISSLTPQITLDQCLAGATALCANITRNDAGAITRIESPTLNLNRLKSAGIDFEMSYRPGGGMLGGATQFRVVASYLQKQRQDISNGTSTDRAGEVGLTANPRWTATGNLNWTRGAFDLFVQERFIAAGRYDVTRHEPVTIEDNTVKSVFYTDVTASYRVGENFRFYATINNLFDRDPPLAPNGTLVTFIPTNPQLYDVIGRQFTAGINLTF
ncbi:TonB-dependent receptor plug domain-containing protein [Novosphingobium lindaniclasticum]